MIYICTVSYKTELSIILKSKIFIQNNKCLVKK